MYWANGTYFIDTGPSMPIGAPCRKRPVKSRLQPRDKAYIRFLHANGVDEQEIVGESDWTLNTVHKAIKNDYGKPHLKISAAEAESHVCPEFHERLRAVRPQYPCLRRCH